MMGQIFSMKSGETALGFALAEFQFLQPQNQHRMNSSIELL